MIDTKVIFAIVGGVWLLLSEIMMSIRKKRNSKVEAYLTANADKALLQLCGKKFWIDGRDLALFETVSAKKLQEIVALPEGSHRIAGIYGALRSVRRERTASRRARRWNLIWSSRRDADIRLRCMPTPRRSGGNI